MCGRYVLKAPEDLSERFKLSQLNLHLAPVYNAAPSMNLPVIVEQESGDWEAKLMRWGLIPRWGKSGDPGAPGAPGAKTVTPINARAETLLEKPMFRNLVARKRCLVPVNGFYEWQQQPGQSRKQPYYITFQDDALMGLAGLYDEFADQDGEVISSYTIITAQPNDLTANLHNRMPVILPRVDEEEWLSREVTDPQQVERLLVPYPADAMTAWPVASTVSNVRNDNPTLIEPIGEPSAISVQPSEKDDDDAEQERLFQ